MSDVALVIFVVANAFAWIVMMRMMHSYRQEVKEMRSMYLDFSKKGADYYHQVFMTVKEMCEMVLHNEYAMVQEMRNERILENEETAKVRVDTDNR